MRRGGPVGAFDATEEPEAETAGTTADKPEVIAPDDLEAVHRKLRAIWQRPHSRDNRPDNIAAVRRALAVARKIATDDEILAGALAHAQAKLAEEGSLRCLGEEPEDWLNDRKWTEPPPPPAKQQHTARGGRRNGSKLDGQFARELGRRAEADYQPQSLLQ